MEEKQNTSVNSSATPSVNPSTNQSTNVDTNLNTNIDTNLTPKRNYNAEIYERFKENPLLWFFYYFDHHVRKESPPFHLQLLRAVLKHRYLSCAAPRESAKSTILTFLYPFHSIVFKKKRFIVIVQNTFKKAAMSLDTMKAELLENPGLKAFKGIQVVKDAEGDSEFKHADGFRTKVLCKGVDQIGSLRGVKFGAYRPDLIIGDDMEDDELVRNPERRTQLQLDFDDALVPAGDRSICQYIVVGTVLHDDSLLAKLVSKDHYSEYHKLFYQAHINADTDKERSLWPEQWGLDWLKDLRKNEPRKYSKEYQNDPAAAGNAKFRKSDFRYWKQEFGEYILFDENGQIKSKGRLLDCVPAIACDLAWKEKRESDSCVILPALLTPNSDILIQDYISGKGLKPTDVSEHLFVMAERLNKLTGQEPSIGFEKAMLENVTQWFLRQEMRRRNHFLTTRELVWDADKITRIETRLLSRYSQHVIFHKKGMGDLEHQLERFPSGAHDDIVDALQGVVQLLQNPRKAYEASNPKDEFETMRKIAIDFKAGKPYGKPEWYRGKVPAYRSFR